MRQVFSYSNDAQGNLFRRGGAAVPDPAPTPTAQTLLDVTFDDWALGSPSTSYWNTRMANGQASGTSAELARHEVIVNPDDAGKVMRLTLLAGVQGGAGSTSMFVPLKTAVDDVTMEVRFKLVGAYDFGLGQKFPGPSGVRPGISPSFPSGGKTVVDEGFSVRCMQATHSGRPDATGMDYIYGSDVTSNYGEDGWWTPGGGTGASAANSVQMTRDTWHVLSTRVKLNTVTPSVLYDGIIHTTWDGATVYKRENRQLRVRSDVHATHLMWHWFYGGADATWAPDTDQHILIDYVKVTAA